MTCPTELTCSQYADGALPPEDATQLEAHLADCARCRERVQALRVESRAIGAALRAAEAAGAVPPFEPRPSIPPAVAWLGGITLVGWALSVAWLSVTSAATLPSWLGWLMPDAAGVTIDVTVGLLVDFMNGSGDLLQGALSTVGSIALLALGISALWLLVRRSIAGARSICLTLAVTAIFIACAPSVQAFEIRHDKDRVMVGPGETIDDTLVVTAENVVVDGTVTGDLIALGKRVTVRGSVGGMLVAMGNEVNVDGNVSGNVISAAETLEFRDAVVGVNLYSAGRTVTMRADSSVAGNMALAAGEAEVYGHVGHDLLAAAEELSLLGDVDGALTVYGKHAEIGNGARVGGDVTAKVRAAEDLEVQSGATVGGDTHLSTWPEEPSRYLTFKYYVRQFLHFLAAFVTGLVLFRLLPALNRTHLDHAADALTAAAIGAVLLVATPVLAIAAMVTLIGVPLGISALLLWLVGLYAGGIVTAALVGRLLLDTDAQRPVVTFLIGLLIVFVLINLPLVGGLFRLVTVVVGLGLIGQWFRNVWAVRAAS